MVDAESLRGIVVFVRAAECRNFTEAAKRLNISPSGVSKAIHRLEERLGTRLLHRTTRSLNLTHDGEAFYESCRSILAGLAEAESAVTGGRASLRGRLRIQMPIGFGQRVIVPLMTEFAAMHPQLTFDAELSDRHSDLAQEAIDVAIRMGESSGGNVIARRLCDVRFVTVAAPAYLERHGEPATPDDLASQRCLVFHLPQIHRYREWTFSRGGKTVYLTPKGTLYLNDAQAVLTAVVAGAGIANLATYVAHDAVRAGLVRIVLKDYVSPGPAVAAVYLERRHLPARVQTFVDYLRQRITPTPKWDEPFVGGDVQTI
jgi:LysR family transcriptional regulator for bpeEF and oprC